MRYDLPRIRPLSAWGSWQRAYPGIGCGLKRGFTFYAHEAGRPFAADPDRRDQLLVAASPNDEVADTHWYRPDFDRFLVGEAERAEGAEYVDRTETAVVSQAPDGFVLAATRQGRRRDSAPASSSTPRARTDSSSARSASRPPFPALPATEGLFTHFEGRPAARRDGHLPGRPRRATLSGRRRRRSTTSSTAAGSGSSGSATASRAPGSRPTPALGARAAAVRGRARVGPPPRTASRPSAPSSPDARPTTSLRSPRRGFPSAALRPPEPGWALLPSAAAFVDPLLSTGIPADAARPRAARARRSEDLGPARLRREAARARAPHALRGRHRRPPRRRPLRDVRRLPGLRRAHARSTSRPRASPRARAASAGRTFRGSFLSGDHPIFGPALDGLLLAWPSSAMAAVATSSSPTIRRADRAARRDRPLATPVAPQLVPGRLAEDLDRLARTSSARAAEEIDAAPASPDARRALNALSATPSLQNSKPILRKAWNETGSRRVDRVEPVA